MIKLIAIDMDGTLLTNAHQLTDNVKKAIFEANERGIKIVLCTGRPLKAVYPYMEQLDLPNQDNYVISLNGTLIQRTNTKEIVYSHQLEHAELSEIDAVRKDFALNVAFFDESHYFYTGEKTDRLLFDAAILNMEPIHLEIKDIPKDRVIYKAMFVGEPEELDCFVKAVPNEWYEKFYPIRSLSYVFELLPKKANKGDGLTGLAELLAIPMAAIMTIGDGENDIDLMNAVEESVAMGNATDSIKAAAKYETKSNEEDGVAYAIYQWALN
ncbi:Cof-type HAD-IIB family hydrolase [Carnobacterium sp. TMP28]|uniref:Cof-type HAD-IIB family hydrolase n=1 Tax=Carnobacterium sp. TMP28 TaxID=3397060 RepID=UPI0039DFA5C7